MTDIEKAIEEAIKKERKRIYDALLGLAVLNHDGFRRVIHNIIFNNTESQNK